MRSLFTLWKMSYIIFPKLSELFKSIFLKPHAINDLSKPWILSKTDTPYWFSRSSISILVIIRWWEAYTKKNDPIIWVPDYFCTETLDLIRKSSYKIHFYPIKKNLYPDWDICYSDAKKNKPDLFILVHYFGNQSDIESSIVFCDKFNSIFIEDAAHVIIPINEIGKRSDFIFYSQYKLFSIPDGALLIQRRLKKYFRNNYSEDPQKIMTSILKKLPNKKSNGRKWFFKKLMLKLLPDLNWFRKNKNKIGKESIASTPLYYFQSDLSKKILSMQINDIDKFVSLRKSFSKTFSEISRVSNYNSFYHNKSILYQIGIRIPSEKIKAFSRSKLKVITRKWPNLPPEVLKDHKKYQNTISMQKEFLFFPVHQNLNYNIIYNVGLNLINYKEKHYELIQVSKSDWKKYFNKCKHSNLLQTWIYGDVKQKLEGWLPKRFIVQSQNKVEAIFQILQKSYGPVTIYRLNRGPLFTRDDIDYFSKINIYKKIKKTYLKRKFRFLFIAPNLENNIENISVLKKAGYIKRNQNYWNSYVINLNNTIENLRLKLNGKWRNQLKKAEKYELSFILNNSNEAFNVLNEKYRENMIKKNFVGPKEDIFNSIYDHDKKNILVGRVLLNNRLIAINLISLFGKSANYEIGWNSDEGRKKYANNFLLWNTIVKLKGLGIENFDLGGINKEKNPGIAKFKNGLSGEEYTLAGEWF